MGYRMNYEMSWTDAKCYDYRKEGKCASEQESIVEESFECEPERWFGLVGFPQPWKVLRE